MGIAVLGPLTLDGTAAAVGSRDRVVLGALALRPGEVVSAERLADALWGDGPPASWSKVVQGCVVRLRKALGPQAIETTPGGYRLTLTADEVDASRFERLVRSGQELLLLDEPEQAAQVIGEGLALWRGPALVDLERWEPGRVEASRLEEVRLDAEEARLDAALRAGRHREVLAEALARVAEVPSRERRWTLLALAQYRAGRQDEALRTLRRARTRLRAETGAKPGRDLARLEQAVRRQDASLMATAAVREPSSVCPYRGLQAYDVGDAATFFGREAVVAACLQRLATAGVLVVVGPSGSGTSSLARAGVAATLRRQGRDVVVVSPGHRPMDALAELPSDAAPVLVVDDGEEAVTLCHDRREQDRFLAALAAHADRAPLVVALRADRLGELSAHPAFAPLVPRGLHLVGPMSDDDLRAAVEGPALHAGLRLEPGLVDLVVEDATGEADALPRLSHALCRTWDRREDGTLTAAGYRETGGIGGAVARSAEEVYEGVPPEQRPLLRDLLLRLVGSVADGPPVPRRVRRREVATDGAREGLIERLVEARLVTSQDGTVALAHEALVRAWPRLQGWLEDAVEEERITRHVAAAAATWDAMGRPDGQLYGGVRLARSLAWRAREDVDLTDVEQAFLEAAEQRAGREPTGDDDGAPVEAPARRRPERLLAAAAVLLVVILVAGLLAVRRAERADTAATAADARRVAAQAQVTGDIDEALLLAVEAVRLDDSADTRANLLGVLARSPELIGSARAEDALFHLGVRPDGRVVAVADASNRVEFHDAATGELVGRFEGADPGRSGGVSTNAVAFSPDGGPVAIGRWAFDSRPVRLLDPSTFEEADVQLGGLPTTPSRVTDLTYSGDGRFLAVTFEHHEAEAPERASLPTSASAVVWAVDAPQQPVARITVAATTRAVELNRDGTVLYTGTWPSPSITIHNVPSGQSLRSVTAPSFPLALSPDGSLLAAPDVAPRLPPLAPDQSAGSDIVLLDALTGEERGRLRGHTGQVNDVAFSEDSRLLASASSDDTATVWDLATGERREELHGHSGDVMAVGFGDEDATLFTAGADRALLTWDLRGDRRFLPRLDLAQPVTIETPGFVGFVTVNPAAPAAAYSWTEFDSAGVVHSNLQFLDLGTGRAGEVVDAGHGAIRAQSWHPDGRALATTGLDGVVRVWDWRRGAVAIERQVARGVVSGLDYTADGTRLLVGELGGATYVVDAGTLEPLNPRVGVDHGVLGAFVSPDGQTAIALTGSTRSPAPTDPLARMEGYALVDLADGRVRHQARVGFQAVAAEFSPDGERVAIAGADGQMLLLDAESGEPLRAPATSGAKGALDVAYAADGTTLVSGGTNGVSLWDGETGALRGTVAPGAPSSGAFGDVLPDGRTVLIASWDGTMHTWDSNAEHWIEFACGVAGRDFTADEWRTVFGDRSPRDPCPDRS